MMFQTKVFYSLFLHLFKLASGIRLVTSQTLLLSVELSGRNKRKRIWCKILVHHCVLFQNVVTAFSSSGSLPVLIINCSLFFSFFFLNLISRSHLAFSLIPTFQFSISQSADCLSVIG